MCFCVEGLTLKIVPFLLFVCVVDVKVSEQSALVSSFPTVWGLGFRPRLSGASRTHILNKHDSDSGQVV